MNPEALLAYGFREYPTNSQLDSHERAFGKWSRDDHGKRFCVHVRFWRHSKYSRDGVEIPDGWDAWCQFNRGGETFDVNLMHIESPQQVFRFFACLWDKLGCDYYEVYE